MRIRVWGLVGIMLGASILVRRLFFEQVPAGSQVAGLVMGGVLVAWGLYFLVKPPARR